MSEKIKREATLSKVTPEDTNTYNRVVKDGKSRIMNYPAHRTVMSITAGVETQIVHNKELFATSAYKDDDSD